MIGQILALITGLGLAVSTVYMRKAVFRTKETTTAVIISVCFGFVIFLPLFLFTGNAGQLATASWQALAALAGAGMVATIIGRQLNYYSLKLIGANRGGPLLNSSTIFAVTVGITVMGEPLTYGLIIGSILIIIGVVLVSIERGSDSSMEDVVTTWIMVKGVFTGLLAGICYGSGPVLIKMAINEGNSPFTAIFISYGVALLIMIAPRLRAHERQKLIELFRKAAVPMSIGAVSIAIAHLLRYISLDYIPVSIVLPINSVGSLFTIFLSYAINRKIEIFTWKIVAGAIFIVVGVFIIFQV
jgi:drug/metabolite transporter (DMT)-like permease